MTSTYENDYATLSAILRVARPHDTANERKWTSDYLDARLVEYGARVAIDEIGNRWATIGAPPVFGPNILFSCHIDTMDARTDEKGLVIDETGTIRLRKAKAGRCLGADDGAGLWLLLELVRAGIPGTYVFHRGEEKGRIGSRHVQDHEAWRLDSFDACIAFDRRGTRDIITHQMSERGCSDDFAFALANQLNTASFGALSYRPDDSGSYTDSYSYFDTIAECTNISIGYDREHGPQESLDFAHLRALRDACLAIDWQSLPIARDPNKPEYLDYSGWAGGYRGGWQSWCDETPARDDTAASLEALCFEYPDIAADLLVSLGVNRGDFLDAMADQYPRQAALEALDTSDRLR